MLNTLLLMFSQPFMQRAIIGGIFISLCSSLLGVSLVLKRYSMIGDGLSHVGFGAVVVASAVGFAPLAVAIPVVVLSAFLLLRLGEGSEIKGDAAVALVSTGALAIGVVASSVSGGMNQDFNSYMFGTILGLSESDVVLSIALSVPVLILFILFYNKIFAVTFDEGFAKSAGTAVNIYNLLIAVVIAVIIVLAMNLVGSLLISALVVFPALSAMRVFKSFRSVTICAAVLGVSCALIGLLVAIVAGTPVGSTIVAVDILAFGLCSVLGGINQ